MARESRPEINGTLNCVFVRKKYYFLIDEANYETKYQP